MDEMMTKEQIAAVHAIFASLAEITKDARNMAVVARRMADKGLITTGDPCDSVWGLEHETAEFYNVLSDEVWNIRQHEEKGVE